VPYDDSEPGPWWLVAIVLALHAVYIAACLL
jgi:hypothetical protein